MSKTHLSADGTVRQDHYGDDEQPWDVIVRLGWGPQFAVGNILKYLRRTKEPDHSLESARWYYERLSEMIHAERFMPLAERPAVDIMLVLTSILTPEEIARLRR